MTLSLKYHKFNCSIREQQTCSQGKINQLISKIWLCKLTLLNRGALQESNFNKYLTSITLKAGMEYTIDVTPTGQFSSERFKALNIEQRKCQLERDNLQNSIFKVYTENNCRYDCLVKVAKELCQCIPWDFMHM